MGTESTIRLEVGSMRTSESFVSDQMEPKPQSSPFETVPNLPGATVVEAPPMRAATSPLGVTLQIAPSSRLCTHTDPNAAAMKPGCGTSTSMFESALPDGETDRDAMG